DRVLPRPVVADEALVRPGICSDRRAISDLWDGDAAACRRMGHNKLLSGDRQSPLCAHHLPGVCITDGPHCLAPYHYRPVGAGRDSYQCGSYTRTAHRIRIEDLEDASLVKISPQTRQV